METGYVVLKDGKEPKEFTTRIDALNFYKDSLANGTDCKYEIHHFTDKSNQDGKLVYTVSNYIIEDIDTYADAFYRYN